MQYAYAITAALLLGGTAATLALQAPGSAQSSETTSATASVTADPPRAGAPMSFADLVARLQPAVVNITTKQTVQVGTIVDRRSGESAPLTEEAQGGGSGFVISADGYIVTNNHVVAGEGNSGPADSVTVVFADRTEFTARIIGRDAASDLALLKIEAGRPLAFVEMASADNLRVGDWVVAIGNPLGLGSSVTAGIVSALQRNTGEGGAYDRFIQTDTAINRGNSGGPLFDLNGRVVGINSRLISPVGANIGINFAIPADAARPVIEALKRGNAVQRGYLGVAVTALDEDTAAALGLPRNRGGIIRRIEPGQGAERAGLRAGDIVIKVGGREITPDQTLPYIVANIAPGQRVPVEIMRDGKRQTVNAQVGTRPTEEQLAAQRFNPQAQKDFAQPGAGQTAPAPGGANVVRSALGLAVIDMAPSIARDLGVDPKTRGVVIDAISPASDAARRGLQRGDIILAANYKPIPNVAALATLIAAAKREGRPGLFLEVQRGSGPSGFVTVRLAG